MKMSENKEVGIRTYKSAQAPGQNPVQHFGGIKDLREEELKNMDEKHRHLRPELDKGEEVAN
ncbi:hypothetical protein GCM10011506_38550 [Marivirga lumbricoides]|uniref:Uncharacterized protein n=1 Tax=Marivirga lumbricoides TaxID=1046115 RepID=A0ABQ1MY10_9BACT|nr:hypothetical protein GCM10011506_38550 [Marivirga lumbricoides]